MSGRIDARARTFTADTALLADRRVKYVVGNKCGYAGADDNWIGMTQYAVAAGEPVSVLLKTKEGTMEGIAADAIADGAAIYGAADGKLSDVASDMQVGIALEAVATGGKFEFMVDQDAPVVA